MTTQQILQGVHDWTNGKIVYDISVAHPDGQGKPTPYADLTAALGTGGANIPEPLRKGGMSVKFIQGNAQSSDNNYLQYRCMANEFTIDTTKWAIADEGVYAYNPEFVRVVLDNENKILEAIRVDGTKLLPAGVKINKKIDFEGNETTIIENPEFVEVKIDNAGHILWAIKADGSIYYGEGVPQQVIDYINEKIAELSLDEYEDIVAFLNGLEEGDKTLQDLLNEKVDKVTGKSLIDAEYASSHSAIENPEFLEVTTDSEDKVLAGRTSDGAAFENVGFSTSKVSINGHIIENIEDPEGRLEIATDSENKIISYHKDDGTLVENVGIETPNATVENISAKEVNIEGGEAILEKATLNSLELTEDGMTEFQQALKNSGFRPGGAGDWSDYVSQDGDYPLNIPIPKCAMLNIISDFDLTDIHKVGKPGAIEGVNYDIPTQVEFYDMSGNYFKKWATMSAQGNSSYAFMKKNLAFDFYDTEANGDAFAFKFGNWVAQDSYHLKAYYTDGFRGINVVNYTLYEQILNTRSADRNREFKKHIPHIGTFSDGTESEEYNSVLNNYDAEARCFPDGFPVVVYQNGVFWGIFAWQLKKHRKNYHLDKKTATHIHLDGNVGASNLFLVNGKATAIGWDATSDAGFEVRNPKADSKPSKSYLFLQADGTPYDADLNAGELLGKYLDDAEGYPDPEQPNPYYDNSNKNHKVCNNVKNNILKLSTYIPELKQMENNSASATEIRARFEEMFDVDNLIDYIAFSAFIGNTDGFAKNWQWVTWDGNIWTVNPYDCDLTYGSNEGRGHILSGPGTDAIQKSKNKNNPCGWIWAYYPTELKARYKDLRDSGILSSDNVINILNTWISRFNIGDWEKEFDKWSETPAHRPSYLNTEYWEFVRSAYGQSATYNENTSYNVGDEVVWMGHNLYDNRIACKYRCVKAHTAYDDPEHDIKKSDFYPCYKQYNNWPQIMGHYDSPSRVKYWIDQTLATQVDAEFNYNV